MTDTTDPTPAEERVARHLAARDWLTDEDRWTNSTAAFRADYLTAAREVIALVREEPADRAAVRCPSCEHEAQYHDVDGRCWFTVEQGVPERDAVCSCQLRRMADETPAAPDLSAADNPTPLRWGLDDVMYGDDDTTTVLLSGPDGEPYWLELEPERAAALWDSLAGPEEPATMVASIPDRADTAPADESPHIYMTAIRQQAAHVHDFTKAGQMGEALEHVEAMERLLAVYRRAVGA